MSSNQWTVRVFPEKENMRTALGASYAVIGAVSTYTCTVHYTITRPRLVQQIYGKQKERNVCQCKATAEEIGSI